MPFDKTRYPDNWSEISLARRQLAGWKCEWCGAPNGQTVLRAPGGYWSLEPDFGGEDTWHTCAGVPCDTSMVAADLGCDTEYGPEGQLLPTCRLWESKVVLTVAHTDLDGGDRHDKHNLNGLRALCQSCHLRYDHADHVRHAAETRRKKRLAAQPELEFA